MANQTKAILSNFFGSNKEERGKGVQGKDGKIKAFAKSVISELAKDDYTVVKEQMDREMAEKESASMYALSQNENGNYEINGKEIPIEIYDGFDGDLEYRLVKVDYMVDSFIDSIAANSDIEKEKEMKSELRDLMNREEEFCLTRNSTDSYECLFPNDNGYEESLDEILSQAKREEYKYASLEKNLNDQFKEKLNSDAMIQVEIFQTGNTSAKMIVTQAVSEYLENNDLNWDLSATKLDDSRTGSNGIDVVSSEFDVKSTFLTAKIISIAISELMERNPGEYNIPAVAEVVSLINKGYQEEYGLPRDNIDLIPVHKLALNQYSYKINFLKDNIYQKLSGVDGLTESLIAEAFYVKGKISPEIKKKLEETGRMTELLADSIDEYNDEVDQGRPKRKTNAPKNNKNSKTNTNNR